MNEYRDPELARMLAAAPAPDHRPSFWNDLSAQLHAEDGVQSDVEAGADPGSETAVITLSDRRSNRPQRKPLGLGLVAAAAAIVAAIGLFAALTVFDGIGQQSNVATEGPDGTLPNTTIDNRQQDPLTDDGDSLDPTERPEDENPFPTIEYNDSVEVLNLGGGKAVGTTPDGSAILVVDEFREQPNLGCEGAPILMLYGQDIATGQRRPLLPDGVTIETGGLRLLFADFVAPPSGGPTPVFLADFCDGFRHNTWLATMAPDGTVTDPQPIENQSSTDPFTANSVSADVANGTRSNDLNYGLSWDNNVLTVRSTDGVSNEQWVYSEQASQRQQPATFTPAGDAVVVNDGEGTVVWRFGTNERWRVPTGEVVEYRFGRSGQFLFLNYLFPEPGFAVLDFSQGPAPVFQADTGTCSGQADLGELQTPDRLPPDLADVLAKIDNAAATCDWPTLVELAGDTFQLGFGAANPASTWPVSEARGDAPMLELRLLLRTPLAKYDSIDDEVLYMWPAAANKLCEDLSDEDLASILTLGVGEQELAGHCEAFDAYVGVRTSFTESGQWQYLVSGD